MQVEAKTIFISMFLFHENDHDSSVFPVLSTIASLILNVIVLPINANGQNMAFKILQMAK